MARSLVQKLSERILTTARVKCPKGGCWNHGDEYCLVDRIWDSALNRAHDELKKIEKRQLADLPEFVPARKVA